MKTQADEVLADEQFESALITMIWEDAIELPESIAITGKLKKRPFHLSVLLSNIESFYSPIAAEKGLTFSMNVGPEISGSYLGDQPKIGRILRSLIDNAVAYTTDGEVTVTCLHRGGELTVTISDTGIGLSSEQLKLFSGQLRVSEIDPLEEISTSGLRGVALSRTLCDVLGGRITVKSEEAVGTVLTVILPLEKLAVQADPLPDGESMIHQWRQQHRDHPGLETVLARGLDYMEDELEQLMSMLEGNRFHEMSGMLHAMKGFPGGFGLQDIYLKIKALEQEVNRENGDAEYLKRELQNLKQLVASIPRPSASGPAKQPSPAAASASGPTSWGAAKRVLIADDDRMNCEMVVYLLKKIDVDYTVVHNGEAVLERLAENRYDLLLIDIRMPVLGGLETVRRIREADTMDDLTIIAMTANDNPDNETRFKALGCDDFVAKPIDLDDLTLKIASRI